MAELDSSFDGGDDFFDEAALRQLDQLEKAALARKANRLNQPAPSNRRPPPARAHVQPNHTTGRPLVKPKLGSFRAAGTASVTNVERTSAVASTLATTGHSANVGGSRAQNSTAAATATKPKTVPAAPKTLPTRAAAGPVRPAATIQHASTSRLPHIPPPSMATKSSSKPPPTATSRNAGPNPPIRTAAPPPSKPRSQSSRSPPVAAPLLDPYYIPASDDSTIDDGWIFDIPLSFEGAPRSSALNRRQVADDGSRVPDSEEGATEPKEAFAVPALPSASRKGKKVAVVDISIDSPPVVMYKRAGAAARRKAIVESSSPQIVAGPSRIQMQDVPYATQGKPKILKRLRRGADKKAEVLDIDDDGNLTDASEPVVGAKRRKTSSKGKGKALVPATMAEEKDAADTRKKKKKKLAKMTEHEAAHCALFDFEAENSDASGVEASSEDYDSENSIDRDFVASEGGEEEQWEESEDQIKFRMKSLFSQAPGFHNSPVRPGAFRYSKGVNFRPPTPVSEPGELDQWSYDSFCVPDDEEIQYDTSSSQV